MERQTLTYPGAGTRRPSGRLSRLLVFLAAVAAWLVLPTLAVAAVELRQVESDDYPIVRTSVVTDEPSDLAPTLTENGAEVTGVKKENLGRAKSIVIAIDQSKSMKNGALDDAIAAARSFLGDKPLADRVAVVGFGSEAAQLSEFTTSTIDADIALRTLDVDTVVGTALYDAIVISANALAAEELEGRVIVVLTDGSDFTSQDRLAAGADPATFAEAIAAAQAAGAAVYPIGIEGNRFDPVPLQQMARQTGGTYYSVGSSRGLDAVYGAVAEELARTWRMEYVTKALPGETVSLTAWVDDEPSETVPVNVPASAGTLSAPVNEEPGSLLPATLYREGWGPWVVGGFVGFVILVALLIAFRNPKSAWLRARLEPHVGRGHHRSASAQRRRAVRPLAHMYRLTERAFGGMRAWETLSLLLVRSAIPLRTVEFVYISAGLAAFAGLFLAAAGVASWIIGLAVGAALVSPLLVAWIKAKRRSAKFDEQLPDLLTTLAASLKAGHSFRQAIQSAVDEGEAPASTELKRVVTEAQIGKPMDQALQDMATRVGSEDFEYVITAVSIQREVGGSLAGLFDMVADTVRQRQQFRRKIKGLTAMGRMTAYVLVALPFVVAFAIELLNPEYLDPLVGTTIGRVLIVMALVMMGIGAFILKRIVSFKG